MKIIVKKHNHIYKFENKKELLEYAIEKKLYVTGGLTDDEENFIPNNKKTIGELLEYCHLEKKEKVMKGKKIKQINNLEIRYTEFYKHAVWTKGNEAKCLEHGLWTLKQAEEFCKNNKDFLNR